MLVVVSQSVTVLLLQDKASCSRKKGVFSSVCTSENDTPSYSRNNWLV